MRPERTVAYHQLLDLVPEVDALEVLRIALARFAAVHPDRTWAGSVRDSTVDVRVLDHGSIRAAVAQALEEQLQDTNEVYAAMAEVLCAEVEGHRHAAVLQLVRAGEEREAHSRYAAALRFFHAAAAAAGPLADRSAQILALRRIGRVQLFRGELAEAEQCYRESLRLAVATDRRKDEVIARTGLGNLQLRRRRWAEAEDTYREALQVAGAHDDLALERAQLLTNLARALAQQDRLEAARDCLGQAGSYWTTAGSPTDIGVWTSIGAEIHWREGRLEAARDAYLATLGAQPPRVHQAAYQIDLAKVFAELGDLEAAWEWGRAAEASALAASAVGYIANIYRGLGNIARESGTEAVTFYEKSVEVARRYDLRLEEADTLIEYARLRARDGNPEEAVAYLEHALEICQEQGAAQEAAHAAAELERLRGEAPPEPELRA